MSTPLIAAHFQTRANEHVYPFIEDPSGDTFYGYGHHDKDTFAAELTDYFGTIDAPGADDPRTADASDIQHVYAVLTHPDGETFRWSDARSDEEINAQTPGSFPLTIAYF